MPLQSTCSSSLAPPANGMMNISSIFSLQKHFSILDLEAIIQRMYPEIIQLDPGKQIQTRRSSWSKKPATTGNWSWWALWRQMRRVCIVLKGPSSFIVWRICSINVLLGEPNRRWSDSNRKVDSLIHSCKV